MAQGILFEFEEKSLKILSIYRSRFRYFQGRRREECAVSTCFVRGKSVYQFPKDKQLADEWTK